MENIKEIFNMSGPVKVPQIQRVDVNWVKHSNGIMEIARQYEPKFKLNDHNKTVLRLFLLYFTGNPNFITELKEQRGVEGNLDKGIMLIGGVGTGKSLMFKIFRKYTRDVINTNSFLDRSAIDIIDSVNVNGVKVLEEYNHNIVDKIARPIRCYVDDIASKNELVNNYGTPINVIEQLLSIRYNIFARYGTLTHVSSNKFPAEMKELYDTRIIDRMKEMFNIIELGGKSFRK